jgi:multicomponent Na+:H+ antiporter subunit F
MVIVLVILAPIFIMSLYRLIAGPSFQDRLLGLAQSNVVLVLILCTLAVWWEQSFYIDIAILYALLSFGETTAFVKVHKRSRGVSP